MHPIMYGAHAAAQSPPLSSQEYAHEIRRATRAAGPLKQRYRAEPEAALITLKAQGKLGEGIARQRLGLERHE